MADDEKFPPDVIEKLGYYVYSLVHPETKRIFYIGKGKGNRVFQHLKEAENGSKSSTKHQIINNIRKRRRKIKYQIHRHGLTEHEAFLIEATLIDFVKKNDIAKLDHQIGGQGSRKYGQKSIEEIITHLTPKKITIKEPSLIVSINCEYYPGISDEEIYEASRKHLNISLEKHNPEYVFSINNGVVLEAYKVEKWYRSSSFPGAWIFKGKPARKLQHLIGGSVLKYRDHGVANPFTYVNC